MLPIVLVMGSINVITVMSVMKRPAEDFEQGVCPTSDFLKLLAP